MVGTTLQAQSARGLVKEGNRQYAAGNYSKALEAYGKASLDAPESPVVAFNRGDALFKQGDFAKAKEAFEQAALKAESLPFEARCRYNLGNVEFRLAQRQRDADPRKALAGYEAAIEQYQDALRLDPAHRSAAHNLEVARILMKTLLDELQKSPQNAERRQKQNQEMQKELEELIQEQQRRAGASQNLDQKQKAGDKRDLSGEMKQASQDQRDTQQKTQALSEKMEESQKQREAQGQKSPSPAERAREEMEKAQKEQGSAAEDLQREKPGSAKPAQDKATEHLKRALEELGGDPDSGSGLRDEDQEKKQGEEKEPGEDQSESPEDQPKGSQEKAHPKAGKEGEQKPRDERAQDILREEQENKNRRMRQVQNGTSPVDKDW